MANTIGVTRTNYFRVTDKEKFYQILSSIYILDEELEIWSRKSENETYYAFGTYGDILGVCICEYCANGNKEECNCEYDFSKVCDMLQEIIHKDDAIIITFAGHEKLRQVLGMSTIITSKDIKHIDLQTSALKQAKEMLNNDKYVTELN